MIYIFIIVFSDSLYQEPIPSIRSFTM